MGKNRHVNWLDEADPNLRLAAVVNDKGIPLSDETTLDPDNPVRYYFAILDLINTKNFKSDIKWISKALSISEVKIEEAISKLKKSGIYNS